MRLNVFFPWTLVLPTTLALIGQAPASTDDEVRFNRDVRPILSEHCFACHGPDKNKRQADLRLDLAEDATRVRDGYRVILPGDPEESELLRRVTSDDPLEQMPPGQHKKLNPQEVEMLRRWIDAGAAYESHWAYRPLERPPVPGIEDGRPTHPIDAFILDRLRKAGIKPSPEADRPTLIRRVSLDLTGLPPSPEQVEAFVKDSSPGAYDRLVDRLLDSHSFAERQAVAWLDAVRYADTVGFHGDQPTSMWPYRDYVLRSFHENKPFDQFTREQIAGDLLPDASDETRVASAFNRLNRMSTEGGAQDKEYRAKYAADRVRTLGMVWLGSTIGCAECHDHKYDPFTTRDFYRFAAYFADIEEKGFYDGGFDRDDWGPRLDLPSPEQRAELGRLDAEIETVRGQMQAIEDETLAPTRAEWEKRTLELEKSGNLNWSFVQPKSAESSQGATLTIQGDRVSAGGFSPDRDIYSLTFEPGPGQWSALLIQTEVDENYPGNRIGRGWVSYLLTGLELEAPGGRRITLVDAQADRQTERYPAMGAIDEDPVSGWGHEFGHSAGHRLLVRFAHPVEAAAGETWTIRLLQESNIRRATIGRFRLALTSVEGATLDANLLPQAVIEALRIDPNHRTDEQKKALAAHYRQVAAELTPLRAQEARLVARRGLVHGAVPTVLTTQRARQPRVVRVLPRGDWMNETGEVVEPGTPDFLTANQPSNRPASRLDLADWLVSDANPLTPRVLANRIWKSFFGVGLSKILEDVGSQGEWPSHPELLDWLACELRSPSVDHSSDAPQRWDLKHLMRLIVTSQTYRQDSKFRPELAERDPDNRLLARQQPIRLEAEFIRDQALASSGLLVDRFGGPSVFPPQPDGYWAPLNFPRREYATSFGDDQYRRSLYTHWQRTFLHPSLLAFDASTREECQVNRLPSNTPLQALVLLNDPIFVEASRALGLLMLHQGGSDDDARVAWGFRRVTGRLPEDSERAVLLKVLAQRRETFRSQPDRAASLQSVGEGARDASVDPIEAASFAEVGRVLLNLHEAITRN